jgi:hypothetical protein
MLRFFALRSPIGNDLTAQVDAFITDSSVIVPANYQLRHVLTVAAEIAQHQSVIAFHVPSSIQPRRQLGRTLVVINHQRLEVAVPDHLRQRQHIQLPG